MRRLIRILYKRILKPILFLFPADYVHVYFLKLGNFIGRYSLLKNIVGYTFNYKNNILSQKILGIHFPNPIGLAAGFDYDADLPNVLGRVGFGYDTVGTVTNLYYGGNTFPMLDRLPKSRSLLVNKGFKSNGIDKVLKKINKIKKEIPLGISLGVTNKKYSSEEEMLEDIYNNFLKANREDKFDYFEINISCPNLIHLPDNFEKFDTPNGLRHLLDKLEKVNLSRPAFIKMHSEKSVEETIALCEIAREYDYVSGFIFSNLVKDRANIYLDKSELDKFQNHKGNFSGKPVAELSNNLISEVYKKYKNVKKENGEQRFIIIGCGGIFEAEDVYEKLKRGASLVQMITGMIYEGPSQISIINRDLARMLKRDGFKNINEVVGSYYK